MLLDHDTSHSAALGRARDRGIKFNTFIDVGAAQGSYSRMVREIWPRVNIVMLEAAPKWEADLEQTVNLMGNAEALIVAASDQEGEVLFEFDEDNPFGGRVSLDQNAAGQKRIITVPSRRLDALVIERGLPGPFAVKLDTHGYERPILTGASNIASEMDLLIFETYNFGPATRRFGQMACFVEEQFGMRCFDLVEPKWRPYDGALWQLDLFFVSERYTPITEWRLA